MNVPRIQWKNRYKTALVLCAKHFACQIYVVSRKQIFKTDQLELSFSVVPH